MNERCLTCHDEGASVQQSGTPPNVVRVTVGPWTLAPKIFSFVGKDTKQMCQHMASLTNGLIDHLRADPLIGMGFEGRRGGAKDPVARPPMIRPDFVTAAEAWLNDRGALCSGWNGFIRQTETFGTHYQFPIQTGTGPSSITVDASEHQTMLTVIHDIGPNGPCTSTAITNDD